MNAEELVWAEQYRPKTVDDCVLPESTKKMVKDAIANNTIPHFLMLGPAGTGKTSLCKAIANELDADLLYINASLDNSIDNIRTKVISFSSTVSFNGSVKIVLLDEIDGLSYIAQNSLKGVIEEFGNTRFFMTSNHGNKVADPLHSRCSVLNFQIGKEESAKLGASFFKRVVKILKEKNVTYDQKAVAELVQKYFPDFRRTLNELQRYASGGSIDSGVLNTQNKDTFTALVSAIKSQKFKEARIWVGQNSDIEPAAVYRHIYDNSFEYLQPDSIPTAILLLSDYQFKSTHAVDQEINLMACITELMVNCTWK